MEKIIIMYILAFHKPNVDKEPKNIKLDAEAKIVLGLLNI